MSEFKLGDTARVRDLRPGETVNVKPPELPEAKKLYGKRKESVKLMIRSEGTKALGDRDFMKACGYKDARSANASVYQTIAAGIATRTSSSERGMYYYEVKPEYVAALKPEIDYEEDIKARVEQRRKEGRSPFELAQPSPVPSAIRQAIETNDPRLNELERRVLGMRYGIGLYGRPHGFKEIGEELNISQSTAHLHFKRAYTVIMGEWKERPLPRVHKKHHEVAQPEFKQEYPPDDKPQSKSPVRFRLEIEGDDFESLARIISAARGER
jgi:predicted DNA binding protein